MLNALNLNTRLKRIILFRKTICFFFLNNGYKSSMKYRKRFPRDRAESRFCDCSFCTAVYIDVWPYFKDLMHYLSNPILTAQAKILRRESKFASVVSHCITLHRLHRATFSLFFHFHKGFYLVKNSRCKYASF